MLLQMVTPGEFCVCHLYDTPPCVNPAHLWLGTIQEDIADKVTKGRQSKGEKHGRAKLTEKDVKEILKSDEPQQALADCYGVYQTDISKIRCGKLWKHINLTRKTNSRIGANNGSAKLTDEKVIQILESNDSYQEIADKHDISRATIALVKRGLTWKHINLPRNKKSGKGMGHSQAKLTDKKVEEIFNSEETCRILADRYGVSPSTISYIKSGKTWKHIKRVS